jgi:hypothetical protein
MVAGLYGQLGFDKVAEDASGGSTWHFQVPVERTLRNRSIKVDE